MSTRGVIVLATVAVLLFVVGAWELALIIAGAGALIMVVGASSTQAINPHLRVIAFVVLVGTGATAWAFYLAFTDRVARGIFLVALVVPLSVLAIRFELHRRPRDGGARANK